MPQQYFDDMLKTVNDHLDVNHWAGPSKWCNWDLQAKCKARDNFDISHQRKWESEWPTDDKGKETQEKVSEKSKTDFKWSHGGVKYGFSMVSDSLKTSAAGKLMQGDVKADGSCEYEWKHSKNEWKLKGILNACSPVMAEKFQMWFNTEVTYKHDGDYEALVKLNNAWDCYSLGVAGKMEGGAWSKQHAQVVYNDKGGNRQFFGRYDLVESEAGIGCSLDKDDFSHSYEARLSSAEGAEGLMGTPVTVVAGGEYELGKKTSLNYTATLGKWFVYNQNIEHKYDDRTTVTVSQAYDGECLMAGRKKPAHDFGVQLVYKL